MSIVVCPLQPVLFWFGFELFDFLVFDQVADIGWRAAHANGVLGGSALGVEQVDLDHMILVMAAAGFPWSLGGLDPLALSAHAMSATAKDVGNVFIPQGPVGIEREGNFLSRGHDVKGFGLLRW